MKKILLLLFVILCSSKLIFSQDINQTFGIRFSGCVKNDFFYDSRQTVSLREGHFLLYPAPRSLDANGKDLNAIPNLNFLSIQTRLTGNITAPDAFGAKVSGVIEADFFGNENAAFVDANGFRLRHAYAKLNWDKTELLFGQFWHPLFITNCFSDVISFNTGAPFQPFSRNPQIRITQKIDNFSVIGALLSQRDFTSPAGSASLRNSALPEMQCQIQYLTKDELTHFELLAGGGMGYKTLLPQLYTEAYDSSSGKILKYSTGEKVGGFSSTAFFKLTKDNITYKIQGVYGQNLMDLTMMGGYGISNVNNIPTNNVSYTSFNTISLWTELIANYQNFQIGLWAGYTEIPGANEKVKYYTNRVAGSDCTLRGTAADGSSAIKSMFRISPRVVYISGKLCFALETEYTSAGFAAKDKTGALIRNEYGKITQTDNLSNLRILFSVILKF